MPQFLQNPFLASGRPQITPLSQGQDFLPTQTMPMHQLSSVGDVQQFMSAYGQSKQRQQAVKPQEPEEEDETKQTVNRMFPDLMNRGNDER